MTWMEMKRKFAAADPAYGPVPTWWWSGDEVTEERVRWQMEKFRQGGLRNICIINLAPMGPAFGCESDRPVYLSDEWWHLFEVTLKEAERLGMRLWFYDQIGFSGANLPARIVSETPEYAGYQLYRFTEEEALPQGAEVILVHERMRYAVIRQGFNWLNPNACAALINRVHKEVERRFKHYLGNTIAGSFQDELPGMPLWTPELEVRYKERYGKELIPLLPALFEAIPGAEEVRRNVTRLAAEQAEEAFFKPLGQWHERNNMIIGFDQAGPSRRGDPNAAQRFYLDYFRTHRWFNAPGNDMDGEVKPHSSMAHMHGGKRVWLEGFHSSGWGGTLEETMHWLLPLFQAGATLYNPHAVYYSTRGGWWEWAPPDTGWRQPYFEHYPAFADTVSRICWLLTQGKHVCDVAVHYPSYAVSGLLSLNDGKRYEHTMRLANRDPNERVSQIRKVYWELVGQWHRRQQIADGVLKGAHRDFDIIDDTAIEKASVETGKLHIEGENFSVLLLCGTTVMDTAARKKLDDWIAAGGTVIAVDVPDTDPEIPGMLRVNSAEAAAQFIEEKQPRLVEGKGLSLHRRTEEADIFLLLPEDGGLMMMNQAAGPDTKLPESAVYRLRTEGVPELWNPLTGETAPIRYKRDGEIIEVEVPFKEWPAALVVSRFAHAAESEAEQQLPVLSETDERAGQSDRETILLDQWTVNVVPTLDNRYGDFDLHDSEGIYAPIERRHVKVKLEDGSAAGEPGGWHSSTYDDSDWDVKLWSEQAAWLTSQGEQFNAAEARPVVYSSVFGDIAERDWIGRMGRVPRRYLTLDMVPKDEYVCARSYVFAPEAGKYWIRIESNAEIRCFINGDEVKWSGQGECSAWISLKEGYNEIQLQAKAMKKREKIRAGIEVNRSSREPLPLWISTQTPNPLSTLSRNVKAASAGKVRQVKLIFVAKGRSALVVNGTKVTEHGDFHPVYRSGQELVDVTSLWQDGENNITLTLPEGEGQVLVDGRIEMQDGSVHTFFTGTDWQDEQGNAAQTDAYTETENLWLNARPHPLPAVGWLMPDSEPADKPLPFVADPSTAGKAVWLRYPLPVGAKSMKLRATGKTRVWINGTEAVLSGDTVSFAPQPAGTIAAVRIEPSGVETEAAVLTAPIRFKTAATAGQLGDWRTALALPHHSGVVEYDTMFTSEESTEAVLDLGHVRGTAEVWLNGVSLGVRLWRPYQYTIKGLGKGLHRLRIRVTNTLGAYYEIGKPTTMVGFHPVTTITGRPEEPSWLELYPSGGMYGPVKLEK